LTRRTARHTITGVSVDDRGGPRPGERKRRRVTPGSVAAALFGAALFALTLRQTRLDEVLAGMHSVGWGFLLIIVLSGIRLLVRAFAWTLCTPSAAGLRVRDTFPAFLTGDALGNLTPLSLAASEPAKAVYLGQRVDTTQAFAALTAENFFYTVSIAIYIAVGSAAMLATFDLPSLRVGGIAALAVMAIGLLGAAWVAWQRPALLSNLLARLPSPHLAAWVDRVRDFETRAYGSAGPGARQLARLTVAEVAFHLLSFAESWLTLYLLTGQSLPLQALILDSVSRAINVVFKLAPMLRVGMDQFSAETFAMAIGLRPPGTGLLTAFVRTVRMLVWAAVGLLIWIGRGRGQRH